MPHCVFFLVEPLVSSWILGTRALLSVPDHCMLYVWRVSEKHTENGARMTDLTQAGEFYDEFEYRYRFVRSGLSGIPNRAR